MTDTIFFIYRLFFHYCIPLFIMIYHSIKIGLIWFVLYFLVAELLRNLSMNLMRKFIYNFFDIPVHRLAFVNLIMFIFMALTIYPSITFLFYKIFI